MTRTTYQAEQAPGGPAVDAALHGHGAASTSRRWQGAWLLACCGLVFAMVVLGGVTRLTGSGLSMVEWQPVTGITPPTSSADWEAEFARYRASPEFQKVNYWMTVEQFKRIYWFEFAHRLLGRLIGVAFAIPLLYFLIRGRVVRGMLPHYVGMLALGGAQGLLGWYMVKSGLVDDPHVSHYRLTAHLCLAVLIYLYMLWSALDLLRPDARGVTPAPPAARRGAVALGALAFLTLVSGGFVAGLKAGLVYNTFPRMGEGWLPPDLYVLDPLWRNWFDNVATVQLDHRLLALTTLVAVLGYWAAARRRPWRDLAGPWPALAAVVVLGQVSLGIATLLLRVPVGLGAAHQAGALLVLTVLLALNHRLRHPTATG